MANTPKKGNGKPVPVPNIKQVKLTPQMSQKAKKLVEDAQTILLWKEKLYSKYVLSTKFIEAPAFPAAMGIHPTSSCLEVFYSPILIDMFQWAIQDAVETLKHEYSHVLLKHCWVYLPDHMKDNIAADIEINQHPWVNVGASAFIRDQACTYEKYGLDANKSRESYYNELPTNDGGGNDPGGDDGAGGGTPSPVDNHDQWKPDPATEEVWRRVTQEILEEAKSQGTLGGDMVEYIEAKWQKVKPLDQILKRIVQKYISMSITEGETRTRPNRRFPLLPGVKDKYGPKIVWAIDTSGSMSTKELQIIMSVARWVAKRIPLDVIQCDMTVNAHQKNFTSKVKKIGLKGRGGTSFKPVFEYIEKTYKDKIDLLVFGTDLCGDFPDKEPKYKVVWLATTNDTPPFGQVVKLRPDKK
jgi:predicted metal-dependent peptidase